MSSKNSPAHLQEATGRWWRATCRHYQLEEHHVRLLTAACEAWDRMVEARQTIETAGMFFTSRFDEPKAHPAVAVERDSRLAFAQLVREIGLSDDPPDCRPPRPGGRYEGRT